MCRQFSEISTLSVGLPDPLTRSYRRVMKPRLPRKVTASARINLNRFWNELEEFYNRYDQRSEKPVVQLPDYTTDTYDHNRESAENSLNESLASESEMSNVKNAKITKQRLPSDDIEIEVSSSDEEIEDEVFWNVHDFSAQAPPRTLLDLIQRLSM